MFINLWCNIYIYYLQYIYFFSFFLLSIWMNTPEYTHQYVGCCMQTVTFRDTLCIISFVPQPVRTLNVSCARQGLYTFLQKCIQQIKSMALLNKTYLRVAQNIQVQCVPVAIMQARVHAVWHWKCLALAWFIPLHKQCHNHLQTQALSQRRRFRTIQWWQIAFNKHGWTVDQTGAEQVCTEMQQLIKPVDKCLQNVCEKQQFVIFPGPGCGLPVVSLSDT